MNALSANNLNYKYGQRSVLNDVDINVARGEILGILGPNGAGKTTLFKLLAGQLKAEDSAICLSGHRVEKRPLWGRCKLGLAYVPQESSVLLDFTVEENLDFGLLSFSKADRKKRRFELMQMFGLEKLAKSRGSSLSGGEKRRVELARGLGMTPTVLLADEPFAALDPIAVQDVSMHLRQIAESGTAVILTDHDVSQAMALCTRVYILHEGHVICRGDPDEVAQNTRVRDTYLGTHYGTAKK
ncbi:MAG: ABC transporter ATP-binding protein [Myxococcales bacterium]|nr:ABC transporter ATP-binding protein [Myxococcales bacterium]|tara:strand:- start:1410 stop:2135 length:726 start_codon:yes stop_codon:yes gene_type:complete